MKGLLIAYSFAPQKTVGALRPTYWAEEISNISDIELDVVTATPHENTTKKYNCHYVENKGSSIWSFAIKDEGLTWKKSLLTFFEGINLSEYDFAIITGGPFFHFSIGKYLKKHRLKVIFDFRDPFSYNPRHQEKGLKRIIKQWFERKCLRSADLVLTVNDACHDYIAPGEQLNRAVLPNGYDERAVEEVELNQKPTFDLFYAGRFYWEPKVFLDVLQSEKYRLLHAGKKQGFTHPYTTSDEFKELGFLSQKEMYNELLTAEIGVLFTIDVPFESTTKIYDYLALNRKILIITKGEPYVGVLNRELENYSMHRWVREDADEIRKAIAELKTMPFVESDAQQFSRKQGLSTLVDQIKKVCHG